MKQQIVLFFSVLLVSSFLASARFLVLPKQGCFRGVSCSSLSCEQLDICENEVKTNDVIDVVVARPSRELEDDDMELMGSEGCNEKDQECFSRRMIAEAHLDYIYTQHHKP